MNRKLPGKFIIFGALQFAFLMLIAEFLYPGYSVSKNYISDLGVGPEPSRAIFTISIILFGASLLIATYPLWKGGNDKIFPAILAIAGIGLIGVGLFNEIDHTLLHILSALLAFGFGGIAAISSSRLSKPSFSYVSIFQGLMSLIALVLLITHNYLDLGVGGMERLVAYPIIFWAIGFSACLIHPTEQEPAM
ncbi:MAG: DUF998 domain-containing protein [Methanotrichaceae archaeon]|nr:DUF998 domain-containing protein [Methanotrichaceae archaeon]